MQFLRNVDTCSGCQDVHIVRRVFTDNVAMEMFLELLEDGEILLAVAYDEASEK